MIDYYGYANINNQRNIIMDGKTLANAVRSFASQSATTEELIMIEAIKRNHPDTVKKHVKKGFNVNKAWKVDTGEFNFFILALEEAFLTGDYSIAQYMVDYAKADVII